AATGALEATETDTRCTTQAAEAAAETTGAAEAAEAAKSAGTREAEVSRSTDEGRRLGLGHTERAAEAEDRRLVDDRLRIDRVRNRHHEVGDRVDADALFGNRKIGRRDLNLVAANDVCRFLAGRRLDAGQDLTQHRCQAHATHARNRLGGDSDGQ